MHNLLQNYFWSYICLLVVAFAGCPQETISKLPDRLAAKSIDIEGTFTQKYDSKKVQIVVTKTDNKELPFQLKCDDDEDLIRAQVYEVGKLKLLFMEGPGFTEENPAELTVNQFAVFKIAVTEKAVVLESLSNQYFNKNPSALPGTKITRNKDDSVDITISATPEQLELFFRLHQDTPSLFYSEYPTVYNRVKK